MDETQRRMLTGGLARLIGEVQHNLPVEDAIRRLREAAQWLENEEHESFALSGDPEPKKCPRASQWPSDEDVQEVFDYWHTANRCDGRTKLSESRKGHLGCRVNEFGKEALKAVFDWALTDSFWSMQSLDTMIKNYETMDTLVRKAGFAPRSPATHGNDLKGLERALIEAHRAGNTREVEALKQKIGEVRK